MTTLPSVSKTKKKRQSTVWTVDEARRFLEHLRATEGPHYAAYVLILVLGLRRGEVLGLTWDGVDLGGEQLWISRQLTRVGGQLLHRQTTKTEDSTASLPLFGLCVSALRHRQRVQEEARKMAGDEWKDSDLTFTTRTGTPIEPRNFNRAFESHCRRAGVPRIRVHDTRHTCASLLAALDVHPRVAMRILRHSQISMTMDVYTQVPSPVTRKALDRLNERLTTESDG
ncbi:site-specific integrase [Nonomuraea insulae]|uniref:Site-specific integrase n=1 Tax=Nonomuraea insulae TaxID=1616787 RepID=A0ABW1D6B2_9ACTN